MQKRITKREIDFARTSAEQGKKRVYVRDSDLTGFVALITPKGSVSYLCEYRQNGKQHRIKIGQHGPLTPHQAREQARQVLAKAHAGESFTNGRGKTTLRRVLDAFYKHHAKDNRYWHERIRHVENNAGPILDRDIRKIKRADIAFMIDQAAERAPSAGRHLLTALRPAFKWAVQRGYIDANPCSDLTAPGKAGVRDRVLSDKELVQIWAACEQLGYPFKHVIQMLILTAQRRSEVAGMTFSEMENDIWLIPSTRTKNNKAHEVDLCPLALKVLNDLPSMGDLLFSTNNRTAPSGFSAAKKRLDKLLPNLQPWRLHDVRRSAASGMSALGILPIVVEHVLNHVSGERGGLVSVYQQYSYRPERKEALLKWGEHIQRLILGAGDKQKKQIESSA